MRDFLKKSGLIGLSVLLGVLLSVHLSAIANQESKQTIPYEDLQLLASVFGKIKSNYVEEVSDEKLIREAINGMVRGLDPHSEFLVGKELEDLKISTQGKFGGLGIEVTTEDGVVKVVSPIEDTPAFRAGIQAGDLIIKIDETVTRGLPLTKAVEMMRGKPGTRVKLTVARKDEPAPLEFNIKREIINVKSVIAKIIEPNYGYIRVRNFQERTGEEVANAVRAFYQEAPLKGLILDVRSDPGGLLEQAVAVSAVFLPREQLIVYTQGRVADARMELKSRRSDYIRNPIAKDYIADLPEAIKIVPMVVLIDAGSASAAEIVAGALQDHKRATLMGAPSFGKGSVQTVMKVDDQHMLKLTTAHYFTPSGRSIQAKGIDPDILIDDGRDILRVREANLQSHLETPNNGETTKAAPTEENDNEEEGKSEEKPRIKPVRFEFGGEKDFQLEQALNQLKGLPVLLTRENAEEDEAAAPKDTTKE
ncbi:MAG: S41 family peptidase [Burkholderiales bacterium]|jgi:carboxyl-terminal processing protease|nr:S41 family peptidase [Burkholderiales bacterium]